MASGVRECCICYNSIIRPGVDEFYELHRKPICLSCRDNITSGAHLHKGVGFPAPQCTVPLSFAYKIDLCLEHQLPIKWVCHTCEDGCCTLCFQTHKAHPQCETLELSIEKLLRVLHITDYLTQFAILRRASDPELPVLQEAVKACFEDERKKSGLEMYRRLEMTVNTFFERLQTLYPDFQNKTVDQCAEFATPGFNSIVDFHPLMKTNIFWPKWSGSRVYFMNLETRAKHTRLLHSAFVIPLYSRMVLLPTESIFLCGGRVQPDTYSQNLCWLLENQPLQQVSELQNMYTGRSNHWLIFYNGFVYVLAGCDERNKFTNKCERFHLATMTWEMIAGMNETRDSVSAIVDPRFNCLYATGGRVDNGTIAESIERFEIGRNVWVLLHVKTPFPGSMLGLVLLPGLGSKLLVFGGLDTAQTAVNRTGIIDLDNGTTEELEGMQTEGGCVVDAPQIYAGYVYTFIFKGFQSRKCERWSLDFHTWEKLESYP